MNKKIQIILAIILSSIMTNTVFAGESVNLIFQLKGLGLLMPVEDNPVEAPEGAFCYEMDLVNPKNDKVIGTGNDCFTELVPNDDGSVVLTNTTFFNTRSGTLISEGLVSVVPIPRLPEDGGTSLADGGSSAMTHITGSIPSADSGDSIIGGTHRFENATGTVRLSGAVEMSEFPNEIMFNCLFVIDLD